MKKKIVSLILCITMIFSVISVLSSCGDKDKKTPDALVIMTETLDGLFNPFYSTSGNDSTIVSMTQIAMLTTSYDGVDVKPAFGDSEAVVVKDYASSYNSAEDTTTYTFVIKNGIKYSDGHPLTIEDVLFNMYVYLDPVYTGSSTMYSTDIVGLADYRAQEFLGEGVNSDDTINEAARPLANARMQELIDVFVQTAKTASGSYDTTVADMKAAINAWNLTNAYKEAISANPSSVKNNSQLLADYEKALQYFREELESDYESAKESYTEDPYKATGEFDEVTSFMFMEGFVTVEYAEKDGKPNADKSKIIKVDRGYNTNVVKDKESAINFVYDSKINSELHIILSLWATAQKLQTEYMAKAKEIVLELNKQDDGSLLIPNISGIVSLGHTTSEQSVTLNGNTYAIAHEHNDDGTPKNADQYDVLEVTINGVDPKAIWNFAFAVAPQHYYAEGNEVDIAANKFGVKYGSFDFMTNEIQSHRNITVPMGAGAYMATNSSNADNPAGNEFFANNVVYFKANNNFMMGKPNIDKVRYQVVSATNAINVLESGSVHFVTPQFTQNNITKLNGMSNVETPYTQQLGYGYIGINAGKVQDINLRKAIMCAMDTELALSYYSANMADKIYYPMSTVSWAYPKENGANKELNGKDYPAVRFDETEAKEKIMSYMSAAGVTAGDSELSIKFTIAGANLTDHPTYQTFQTAAKILNDCGWDIEVVPDTQALTKLATGSLAVWAAAWGTTVDPDMYQVYHKNSTATSVLAWGYREILNSPGTYPEETYILNELSALIDAARETDDKDIRRELYEDAMGYVLDLAIELPVYQRMVLYAYNSDVIDKNSIPADINPYSSPLDKMWEIKFANAD